MKLFPEALFPAACAGFLCAALSVAGAQISNFQHIIVVIQENRTPDNLFQGLCVPPYGKSTSCSTTPTGSQYDIQTSNWKDKTSTTGVTKPGPVKLANGYDLGHKHSSFTDLCDVNAAGVCLMDGAALNNCVGACPTKPPFKFVDNTTGIVNPYLDIATQYGWANYMFQTNQGPSFPAHQFLFGGTSAPSASDDAIGTFAAENVAPDIKGTVAGCIALQTTTVSVITTAGETTKIYPCFEHETLSDLLDSAGISWKYYTGGTGSIWTAPNAINHICQPSQPYGGSCTGPDWVKNVVPNNPKQVLSDISKCSLPAVSWVIPSQANSDHPQYNTGGGPSWVASIVNQIGNNKKCANGELYWDNTAILITWDDWGGWYDHEPPTFLAPPQGDYQYGFRVPLLVVSAYTSAAYVDNTRYDFGSVLRFIEQNFGIAEGALNFADARSTTNLTAFFSLTQPPRVFTTIPSPLDANYFINDPTPFGDPDDY
ncbi:MAG TPA: alkaline phosphatase family protein [Candidatus Dormibacteraeota bacterium]|nr:alkaline phosphatase family protein [Candidatus Dormibacteraeota bacterium]